MGTGYSTILISALASFCPAGRAKSRSVWIGALEQGMQHPKRAQVSDEGDSRRGATDERQSRSPAESRQCQEAGRSTSWNYKLILCCVQRLPPVVHKSKYRGQDASKHGTHAVGRSTIARHYNGSSEICELVQGPNGKLIKSNMLPANRGRIAEFEIDAKKRPRARPDQVYKEVVPACI